MLSNGKAKAVGGGRKLKSEDDSTEFSAFGQLTFGNWSNVIRSVPEKSGIVGEDNFLGQFQGVFLIGIHQGHFLHLIE